MCRLLIQFLCVTLILSACSDSANNDKVNLSMGVIQVTPKSINLVVDTETINGGQPTQSITFTNIGRQPVTGLTFKGFKDESAPLTQSGTCTKDLAAGGSCEISIRLHTSHKFASSGVVSRSTVMNYEYNNGSEKKSGEIPVNFRAEKWIASVFITNAATNGQIEYKWDDRLRAEDVGIVRAGADSADYYCRIDKNNPHNGYDYQALIYDTTQRAPYLHWVLYGGYIYFSVMPKVYHQKVWQTGYKQATTDKLLTNVYNCIGVDCTKGANLDAQDAWVGLQLNNDKMNMDTCGTAGNAWKSGASKYHGITFAIKSEPKSNSMSVVEDDASCELYKKIICVSM